MQFQVPQNIDLEDKLVGPLTLIQFLYILGGGLIDYMLLTWLGTSFVFWVLAIPIGLVALALAFLKIQEQPLLHFIKAGLIYLSRPKVRIWQRQGEIKPILIQTPAEKAKAEPEEIKRRPGKSELEQLAYALDTSGPTPKEEKRFGKITEAFEKMLNDDPNTAQK